MTSDWRDEDSYSDLEGSTAKQWAWEFLRRNPEYREAWESGDSASAAAWGLEELTDPDGECPRFLPPSYGAMLIGERDQGVTVPAGHVRYDFDLTQPLAPQLEKAGQDLRLVQEMEQQIGTMTPPVFRRQRRDKWVTYLRVLDAEADGAPQSEIGKHFFPKRSDRYPEHPRRQAAHDLLRQARLMVNGGYRKLLSIGD